MSDPLPFTNNPGEYHKHRSNHSSHDGSETFPPSHSCSAIIELALKSCFLCVPHFLPGLAEKFSSLDQRGECI